MIRERKENHRREAAERRTWRPWLRGAAFALVGAAVGAVYFHFFGCGSGCAIASSPLRAMAYMALIGWLLSQAFDGKE